MYLHGAAPHFPHRKVVSSIDDVKGLVNQGERRECRYRETTRWGSRDPADHGDYDSIQKGLWTGSCFPSRRIQGWKFAEVLKTSIENYAVSYMTSMYVIMNKGKWNRPLQGRSAGIEKINDEWNEKQGKLWVQLDNSAKEYAIQKGVKFVKASKEEEAKTAEKMKPSLPTTSRR